MSSSEADKAGKKAAAARAKVAEIAKAAKKARAEADAAERAEKEARAKIARIEEKKAAAALTEEAMTGRLAAKEKAARVKVDAAKTAWEKAKGALRNFEAVEAAMKLVMYRAVSAAAEGKDRLPAWFLDGEDAPDNVKRAVELLHLDPMEEQVPNPSLETVAEYMENPWKAMTQDEREAWSVVRTKMEEYNDAWDVLDSAFSAAYGAAKEAARAEMERLCEAVQIDVHWYNDKDDWYSRGSDILHPNKFYIKIKHIRRPLVSTARPGAGEIVRQIRSSMRVLLGLDMFFETDAVMTLIRYERHNLFPAEPDATDRAMDVLARLGLIDSSWSKNEMDFSTLRSFHNTVRRLNEMADGLEAVGGSRDGAPNDS